MKKILSIVIVAILSITGLFMAAQSITNYSLGTANIENGKEKYQMYCITCHGAQGHGDGIASAALTVKPDNLIAELNNPIGFKLELVNSVLEGDNGEGGLMPAFKGTLTKEDINDIFGYIESIN